MTRELEDYPEEYPEKTSPSRGCMIGLGTTLIIILLAYLITELYFNICTLVKIFYAN